MAASATRDSPVCHHQLLSDELDKGTMAHYPALMCMQR
jgi:hypothetical protein